MSQDFGAGSSSELRTLRGRDWPSVRQFSVFLENRVGALMGLVRRFEGTNNRIVALSVIDSADCAIVRLVLSDPDRAKEIFDLAQLPYLESDLLAVQLPEGPQPLAHICKALLAAEINIHYAYPLMINPQGRPALALHVDDHSTAVQTLARQGFVLFTEKDLQAGI
ncbi:MAG: acetolactate synthase [Gemmataceae bacterium]